MTADPAAAPRDFALTPPGDDVVEVSLFGARKGECCMVHAGAGRWIVVDSLPTPRAGEPVALAYLAELGIDPASAVRLVIASHWHQDHVGGLSEVFAAAPNSRFCCSPAFNSEEFRSIIGGASRVYQETSPMREVDRVFRLLEAGAPRLRFGIAERPITPRGMEDTEVVALSPSDATALKAIKALGRLVPRPGGRLRLPGMPGANWRSVATWIRVGNVSLLLGADLEQNNASGAGWGEVLDDWDEARAPITVFKVPHHGSRGADEPDVWRRLLAPGAWCIVTPYGSSRLPLLRDRRRLCQRSERTWLAGSLHDIADSDPELAQAFEGIDSSVRRVAAPVGQVRLRAPIAATEPSEWRRDWRFPAGPLCGTR